MRKMKIELTENEIKFLMQYAEVYKHERGIDCTADPIVVVEDIEEIVTEEGFGDKTVYVWNEETYYSLDEVETELKDNGFSKNAIEAFCDDLEYFGQCNNQEIQKHEIIIKY